MQRLLPTRQVGRAALRTPHPRVRVKQLREPGCPISFCLGVWGFTFLLDEVHRLREPTWSWFVPALRLRLARWGSQRGAWGRHGGQGALRVSPLSALSAPPAEKPLLREKPAIASAGPAPSAQGPVPKGSLAGPLPVPPSRGGSANHGRSGQRPLLRAPGSPTSARPPTHRAQPSDRDGAGHARADTRGRAAAQAGSPRYRGAPPATPAPPPPPGHGTGAAPRTRHLPPSPPSPTPSPPPGPQACSRGTPAPVPGD